MYCGHARLRNMSQHIMCIPWRGRSLTNSCVLWNLVPMAHADVWWVHVILSYCDFDLIPKIAGHLQFHSLSLQQSNVWPTIFHFYLGWYLLKMKTIGLFRERNIQVQESRWALEKPLKIFFKSYRKGLITQFAKKKKNVNQLTKTICIKY